MKHIIKRLALMVGVIAMVVLVGCRRYDAPAGLPKTEPVTMSLAALGELVGERTVEVGEPIVVGGYVTTSDEDSNFHKTLIIDDGTAGAEVMLGIYDSYHLYPLGYYVTIALQGCGIGRHYGVMQIGLPAEEYSGFPTDYFSSRVMLDRHIQPSADYREVVAEVRTIDELSATECGRLVKVEGLELVSNLYPDVWKVNQSGTWREYNIFQDEKEQRIAVYTSEYADYADSEVPAERLSLTGILQTGRIDGEDMFMLKMRYEEDCKVEE